MNYKKNKLSNEGLEQVAATLAEMVKRGKIKDPDGPEMQQALRKLRLSPADTSIVRYLMDKYL